MSLKNDMIELAGGLKAAHAALNEPDPKDARIAELERQVEQANREVESVLQHMGKAIRVREGGAAESLYASLAVSVAALSNRAETAEAKVKALEGAAKDIVDTTEGHKIYYHDIWDQIEALKSALEQKEGV